MKTSKRGRPYKLKSKTPEWHPILKEDFDRWWPKDKLALYYAEMRKHDSYYNLLTGVWQNVPKCAIHTPAYTRKYIDKHGFQSIYYDYAVNYVSIPGFHFLAAWTPYGISMIDDAFSLQIQAYGTPECYFTFEDLKQCILRHPNLHPIIRNNLYSNLLSYKKMEDKEKLRKRKVVATIMEFGKLPTKFHVSPVVHTIIEQYLADKIDLRVAVERICDTLGYSGSQYYSKLFDMLKGI